MKVIEGLKIGNECLNKMHQVSLGGLGAERRGSLVDQGGGLSLRPQLHPGRWARGKVSDYEERLTV